jgi:transcriptional regulator with XRE-family HTH domain
MRDVAQWRRLGVLLRDARLRARLTQAEVAARLGEHQSWIARIETGKRKPCLVELYAVAPVLGADPVKTVAQVWRPQI